MILKNFEFLTEISISKYIYACLYYLIFQNKFNKKEAINLIRRIDRNSTIYEFVDRIKISESDIINNKHYFNFINAFIEKFDNDANNYELFIFCFELSSAILNKIAKFYVDTISEKKEEIFEFFFKYKDNHLFNIAINNVIKLSNEINIIS